MFKTKQHYVATIRVEPNDPGELKILEKLVQADSPLQPHHKAIQATTEPYKARSMNHATIKASVIAQRFGRDLVGGTKAVTLRVEAA